MSIIVISNQSLQVLLDYTGDMCQNLSGIKHPLPPSLLLLAPYLNAGGIIIFEIGVKRREWMQIWMLLLSGIVLYAIFYAVHARFIEKRSVLSRIIQDSLTVGNFVFSSMMVNSMKNLQRKGRKAYVWPEKKAKQSVSMYDVKG